MNLMPILLGKMVGGAILGIPASGLVLVRLLMKIIVRGPGMRMLIVGWAIFLVAMSM